MKRVLWATMLAVVLFAGPAWAQSSTAIVAGQHMAGIRVGGSLNDAVGAFGSLYESRDTGSGKYTLYAWFLRPYRVLVERESGKIVLIIVVLSDAVRTDKGSITGGTERVLVEAAYGKEFMTDEDEESALLIYDPQGIAFEIGKQGVMSGRVLQIIVFVPGQWKAITEGV